MQRTVRVIRPGLVPYRQSLEMQQRLITECREDAVDSLLLLQHPPVFTAGRRSAGFAAAHAERLGRLGAEAVDVSFVRPRAILRFRSRVADRSPSTARDSW